MWLSDKLIPMLNLYEKSLYVKEVLIINNDITKTPYLSSYTKVSIYTKGKNIYVNPAWNWGVSLANYNIILANDDIYIEKIDEVLELISECDFDIVGVNINKQEGDMQIKALNHWPSNSYGCFMYVRNYKHIPDELLIWYGDRILFKYNKRKGRLYNSGIITNPSTTINSDSIFREVIGRNDIINFNRLLKENKI